MIQTLLQINDLHVSVGGKNIISGLSLEIEAGKIVALMGPNGSGKSSLANAIAGHPKYKISQGRIIFQKKDITQIRPDLRARQGIFLSFQHPKEIPGVSVSNFLRSAYQAVINKKIRVFEFRKILQKKVADLQIPDEFMERSVNVGFSGGEKKKMEILQAMMLEPKLIILDETDSGLDVDALKTVAQGIKKLVNSQSAVLIITHHRGILNYLQPDKVYVMKKGQIIKFGGGKLVKEIESKGFKNFK